MTDAPAKPTQSPGEAAAAPPDTFMEERFETPILELPIAPEVPVPPPPFMESQPTFVQKPEPALWHNRFTGWHDKWVAEQGRQALALEQWNARREAHQALVDEQVRLDREMRFAMAMVDQTLFDHCTRRTLVVATTHGKGGVGKTPSATNLAARFSQATRRPVILYDGNPDFGGSAARSGVNPEGTLTLSQYYERHEHMTFTELCGLMPPSRHNVLVVAADPDEIARNITPEQTKKMLASLKRHARVIVVDLGTGVSSPVNEAVHKMADVFVFPMLTTSGVHTTAGAVDGRVSTQKRLITQSTNDPDDPHDLVALKANYSLTVAIGVRPEDDLAAFQTAIGANNKMLPIPWDKASSETKPVWLPTIEGPLIPVEGRVSAPAALAWGKAAIALYEQADEIEEISRQLTNRADGTCQPHDEPAHYPAVGNAG